jgi:putative intracellular protease/amidase
MVCNAIFSVRWWLSFLVLRRAEIEVDVVSIEKTGHDAVKCSRNVRVVPDKSLDDIKNNQYDCVVIPGGNDGRLKSFLNFSFHDFCF